MLLGITLVPMFMALLVIRLPAALRRQSWLLALVPTLLFGLLASTMSRIARGEIVREQMAWIPSIGLSLSFRLDGLSLLFSLLITGIGTLIVLYAAGYLAQEKRVFQFQSFLLLFMGAMLGVVLADNLLALFAFWELTSISSFLLVGFMYRAPAARQAARMALIVTGAGGLALLGGIILLGQMIGSYEISALLASREAIQASTLYPAMLTLVLLGCFTKSAQIPFHFWLPGAMSAPTPASAYLHSATMVKAGIYLMARLSPALGDNDIWTYTLVGFGLGTLVLGSTAALIQTDLKALLAYTTLAQLGALTAMIGLGAEASKALVVGILSHALYKAALFMASGSVQHATHSRDIRKLGGLVRLMPFTAGASWVAVISMAGLPPLMGFLGKEKLIEAFLEYHHWPSILTLLTVGAIALSGALTVTVALRFAWDTFTRPPRASYEHPPHEASPFMLIGPIILAALSLLLVFAPGVGGLLGSAAAALSGKVEPVPLAGALWVGVTPTLLISLAAIGVGLVLFVVRFQAIVALNQFTTAYTCAALFERSIQGLLDLAYAVGRPLERLRLRESILLVFLTMIALTGWGLLFWSPVTLPTRASFANVSLTMAIIVLLLPISAIATVVATTRLKAVAALGIVGAMVSLVFALFSAPDLALTQLLVETLSLVFMLIAFARLPRRLIERATKRQQIRDIAVAALVGVVTCGLTLMATQADTMPSIFPYYVQNSLPLANGANIVNVILVDFRGYDTLGEITVLCTAALGAYAVLRTGRRNAEEEPPLDRNEGGSVFVDGDPHAQELLDRLITTPLVTRVEESRS